ncbi:MAG TPA: L-histidine N(alpha)-methyltransferase [Saprospiraceae bacterium]|nr:L-histidine N(alpha)-methyltransferase [Saprospiraceae bacterium]
MSDLEAFRKHVTQGLRRDTKQLSSKYFYDEKGDQLFQRIMRMPGYYLPRCEMEIIREKSRDIAERIDAPSVEIIELGAGDGSKTKHLLSSFQKNGKQLRYIPLDISKDVLVSCKENVLQELPGLKVECIDGDYFKTLSQIERRHPAIWMFMGSNIGNYLGEKAHEFLQFLYQKMKAGDYLLLAADLMKHPKIILNAYNDPEGITRAFNLNLLERINRELDANFDLESFDHYPYYDPISGTTFSFLVSLAKQQVTINGEVFNFEAYEVIHTEVSQKYRLRDISQLGKKAGFEFIEHFTDQNAYYTVSMFQKK